MSDLQSLFTPSRVAVFGATDSQPSVGRALIENLDDFDGEVVPVNPDQDTVLGHDCYPSIDAIPDPIDLAVVAVPADEAVTVVREAGMAGVENVVVVTSDLDADREGDLIEIADEYDLDLVGPNCLGVVNTANRMNATFTPTAMDVPSGSVSFMSQSGGFVSAVLDRMAGNEVGFRQLVSLGNKAVLGSVDFLRQWNDETAVILAFLEDIENGRSFIDVGRDITTDTPLVVLKAGQTEAGGETASSHTGAMAGSATAARAGLDQAGAIRADTAEEFLDFGQLFADQPIPETATVGVITNTGGPGVLTSDAIEGSNLSLASFENGTRETLEEALPDEVVIENPLDIVGDATADRYREALDAMLADETIGGVLLLACPTAVLDYDDLAAGIVDTSADTDKPLLTCLMGDGLTEPATTTLRDGDIPNYFDPARAVQNLSALAEYREIRTREYGSPTEFDVDEERAREGLSRIEEYESNHLDLEAMDVLDAYGIPTPTGQVVDDPSEAEAVARQIDGLVVMKIVSPDIPHKSDFGGVVADVETDDVADTFDDLYARAQEHEPDATLLGLLVQEQADADDAQEVIIGMNRDPQFGPVIVFGYGGIFVQIFDDTTARVAPVTEDEAREMTEELDSAPLLRGARGDEAVDLDAVVETIQRVSQLVTDFPMIAELDINPLIADPSGVSAVDLRITIDGDE